MSSVCVAHQRAEKLRAPGGEADQAGDNDTAEQVGLSAAQLRCDFGCYIERFDAPLE